MTLAIAFFILGLLIGSFLNVCIHRLPAKESIVFPRSYCPSCKNQIPAYDNIPIIGFLFLRGRCRSCKTPISWRYPAVELLNGVGYLLILHFFGKTPETLIYAGFFSALVVITFIDLTHQIIPDVITLPGIPLCFIAASTVLSIGFMNSLQGILLGGGFFYLIAWLSLILLKKEGMGGGDIKLTAMIGALLGWQNVLLAIFSASIAGSIVGLTLIGTGLRNRSDPIPFGPFLVIGALIALFFGDDILIWYLLRS